MADRLPDALPNYVHNSGEPKVAGFEAQRWLIDNVIPANGPDWDQPPEELSPLIHTERIFTRMTTPRQLVTYQESRHLVGNVASCNLAPFPATLVADWMDARLTSKPFASEHDPLN